MKKIETENHVKDVVRQHLDKLNVFSFAVVQNGMGTHGLHDRIGCLPVVITPEMVGKTVGVFLSVEAKRPGRRGEPNRGMSKHQALFMEAAIKAGGVSICCDGYADLEGLDRLVAELIGIA